MGNRPCVEEAVGVLRDELAGARSPGGGLTTRDAWLAYLRFGRRRFDTAPTPDADGLLFQYGTHTFTGTPKFTLALTRQFAVVDANGAHEHHLQVHCELRYAPTPALTRLGSFHSWFFHDADADVAPWADAMGGRLVALADCVPGEVEVYAELA